ncbi:MAG TPA: hypothetical protein VFW16_15855, partial [Streptosporangiaceae bacterium]|nr:hypothetical protein [Streptosporangiaceae bacterium]
MDFLTERDGKVRRLDKPTRDPVDRPDSPTSAAPARDALRQRLADLPPWHPSSPRADRPEGKSLSFADQVPRFEARWKSHEARWPDKPADKTRHDDPPGSWRGRGDHYLNPRENSEADCLIADLQRPEPQITQLLQEIERDNSHGGVLAGLEHRLKGTDRLKEKIITRAEGDLGGSLTDVVNEIKDAIRYTFCFNPEQYVSGYFAVCQRLESAGYQMIEIPRNRWGDDPEYNGINTCWQQAGGGRFELQFHTPESFYAKEE